MSARVLDLCGSRARFGRGGRDHGQAGRFGRDGRDGGFGHAFRLRRHRQVKRSLRRGWDDYDQQIADVHPRHRRHQLVAALPGGHAAQPRRRLSEQGHDDPARARRPGRGGQGASGRGGRSSSIAAWRSTTSARRQEAIASYGPSAQASARTECVLAYLQPRCCSHKKPSRCRRRRTGSAHRDVTAPTGSVKAVLDLGDLVDDARQEPDRCTIPFFDKAVELKPTDGRGYLDRGEAEDATWSATGRPRWRIWIARSRSVTSHRSRTSPSGATRMSNPAAMPPSSPANTTATPSPPIRTSSSR